jgi:hypothetical protein
MFSETAMISETATNLVKGKEKGAGEADAVQKGARQWLGNFFWRCEI